MESSLIIKEIKVERGNIIYWFFFLNAFIPKKGWLKGAKQSAHPKTTKKIVWNFALMQNLKMDCNPFKGVFNEKKYGTKVEFATFRLYSLTCS